MSEDLLLKKVEGNVCTLTVNNQSKLNSLNPDMLMGFHHILGELNDDDNVRCVVVRGAGDKAFSAGYDISKIPISEKGHPTEPQRAHTFLKLGLEAFANYKYPIIAMIQGHCAGAGMELAISCDIRIAADNSRFMMPPAKLGVLYSYHGTRKLLDLVGLGNTCEVFFTGRRFDAERAKEIGLVNHVVPREELEDFTYQMAGEIGGNAPLTLMATKKIIGQCLRYRVMPPEALQEIAALTRMVFDSEDVKEGQKSFAEKRKPQFKGR
jgi:enoyl-CoA hydratase/carnithine racemase